MELSTETLLKETKEAFSIVRGSVVMAMQKLHAVHESDAWQGVCSSWSEYVESELGISQSFASKLLAVNKHYLVEGGYAPENIAGIDYESLYLAKSIPGTVEEQISMASTLSRKELKETKNDREPVPCDHKNCGRICFDCHLRMYDESSKETA